MSFSNTFSIVMGLFEDLFTGFCRLCFPFCDLFFFGFFLTGIKIAKEIRKAFHEWGCSFHRSEEIAHRFWILHLFAFSTSTSPARHAAGG